MRSLTNLMVQVIDTRPDFPDRRPSQGEKVGITQKNVVLLASHFRREWLKQCPMFPIKRVELLRQQLRIFSNIVSRRLECSIA